MTEATRALVVERIGRVFPDREVAEVLSLLDRYGAAGHHRERDRVQLAVLKLCDEAGQDDPAAYVEAACADYRDVLALAEYPKQTRHSPGIDPRLRETLIEEDRAQYLAWLEGR